MSDNTASNIIFGSFFQKHSIWTLYLYKILLDCWPLFCNSLTLPVYILSLICKFTNMLISPADTWPMKFDDSRARADWNWRHDYDVDRLCQVMFDALIPKYGKTVASKTQASSAWEEINFRMKVVIGFIIADCMGEVLDVTSFRTCIESWILLTTGHS